MSAVKIEGLSFNAMYDALRRTLEANPPLPRGTLIEPLQISIHHRIQLIRELTSKSSRVRFTSLLADAKSRVQVIVVFLAVLESIKRRLINVQQDGLFGEIFLMRRDDSTAPSSPIEEEEETEFTGA